MFRLLTLIADQKDTKRAAVWLPVGRGMGDNGEAQLTRPSEFAREGEHRFVRASRVAMPVHDSWNARIPEEHWGHADVRE